MCNIIYTCTHTVKGRNLFHYNWLINISFAVEMGLFNFFTNPPVPLVLQSDVYRITKDNYTQTVHF